MSSQQHKRSRAPVDHEKRDDSGLPPDSRRRAYSRERSQPTGVAGQLDLLYNSLLMASGTSVLLAVLLVGVLWSVANQQAAAAWLVIMTLAQAARLGLWMAYRRAGRDGGEPVSAWLKRFRLGAIGTGMLWGLATWLLFPEELTHQVFMAFVLAGLSAGAVTTLAPDRPSALGYVTLALAPLILNFLVQGDSLSVAMATMISLFLAFVAVSGSRWRQTLLDNEALIQEAYEQRQALDAQQWRTGIIADVQSEFIREGELEQRRAFDDLLTGVLELTASEYGFIGEVLRTAEGAPYLKTYAITNIAWNDTSRAFYEANAPQGMDFLNLSGLFGAALTSGAPVIANNPSNDPRSGGLPEGHPPLNAFLGIPIHHRGELVAMLGISNRPGGYDQALVDFLAPLLVAVGQLVTAVRLQQQHRADQLELARLSRVASQTTNGVIITDVDGRVEWINDGFTRIAGYILTDMRGRKPGELLQGPDTNPATVAEMHDALARSEGFEADVVNYTKDGNSFWIRIQCNPLRDDKGTLQGFMAIQSDITETKRIESIKSEFIATVSHELRTPLTAISGALGLLSGGALGELPERAGQMIGIARKNSQHLGYLINDLLDMEKLVAGKMRFELQAQLLQPLLEQAIQNNQAYADQFGVHLRLGQGAGGAQVKMDADRLQQVLANLLSNAAKFSPEGGEVVVAAATCEGLVRVSVSDRGPGVPEEFHTRIFEKFSQADASDTRQRGGSGLGLAISRELVERMGGRIGFDSVAGEGTTFYFELPLHLNEQTTRDDA